jgi:fructokinase
VIETKQHTAPLLGIDLGGTKIEAALLGPGGTVVARERIAAPREDYSATLRAVAALAQRLDADGTRIGIGVPGSIAPATGLMQNANSTWLNGKPFNRDLEAASGRRVRLANDANCFTLSEAVDGAGAGYGTVFGVILGTGCGGGLAINARVLDGPRGIGGEWGHNALPWPKTVEVDGPRCWCGRAGCIESWVSGPALAADHHRVTGLSLSAKAIATEAQAGDEKARATLYRHADRLARGLAQIVNVIDPDVIVLGGGLSKLSHLYQQLPELMAPHIFADDKSSRILPPKWGDASGVRGAAWLWR